MSKTQAIRLAAEIIHAAHAAIAATGDQWAMTSPVRRADRRWHNAYRQAIQAECIGIGFAQTLRVAKLLKLMGEFSPMSKPPQRRKPLRVAEDHRYGNSCVAGAWNSPD